MRDIEIGDNGAVLFEIGLNTQSYLLIFLSFAYLMGTFKETP